MKIFWREKQYDEKMRTSCIQIMIWVGLVLIQMMIVGCLTVRAEIQEGGKETIEKKLEYTQLEEGMDFPETIEVQVKTEQGTETVLCRAAEQRVTGERWLEDFSFPVTFHRYHSDYYRLGEFLVPFQEEKPKLEGCESELLRQLGLSSDAYEILDFQWQGGTYLGQDGTLCRDGIGTGRRLVRDYLVTYRGTYQRMAETEELQESEEQKPNVQEAGLGGQGEDSWEGAENYTEKVPFLLEKGNAFSADCSRNRRYFLSGRTFLSGAVMGRKISAKMV